MSDDKWRDKTNVGESNKMNVNVGRWKVDVSNAHASRLEWKNLRRTVTTADSEKSALFLADSISGVGTGPHSERSEVQFALAFNSGGQRCCT